LQLDGVLVFIDLSQNALNESIDKQRLHRYKPTNNHQGESSVEYGLYMFLSLVSSVYLERCGTCAARTVPQLLLMREAQVALLPYHHHHHATSQ